MASWPIEAAQFGEELHASPCGIPLAQVFKTLLGNHPPTGCLQASLRACWMLGVLMLECLPDLPGTTCRVLPKLTGVALLGIPQAASCCRHKLVRAYPIGEKPLPPARLLQHPQPAKLTLMSAGQGETLTTPSSHNSKEGKEGHLCS